MQIIENTNLLEDKSHAAQSAHADIRDDNVIINLLSKFLIPIGMIFALYVHIYGDFVAGGGFQSGVIMACILCLYGFTSITIKRPKVIKQRHLTVVSFIGAMFYLLLILISNIYKFQETGNAMYVFYVEIAIGLVIFSSVLRILNTLIKAVSRYDIDSL